MEKFSDGKLERYFQTIYLDQRGVGCSTSPGGGNYSMDRMAVDFETVRTALGIQSWLTMGHSIFQVGDLLFPEPPAVKSMPQRVEISRLRPLLSFGYHESDKDDFPLFYNRSMVFQMPKNIIES